MRAVLVVMPFAAVRRPMLGASLLKAAALETGVACDIAYLNIAFAEMLGLDAYDGIIDDLPLRALPGEWVFADAAWGRGSGLPSSYVDDMLVRRWGVPAEDVDVLRYARDRVRPFLESALADVAWSSYDLVGFSSCTSQTLAGLALARLVREAAPNTTIVFGGSDWHGEPGRALFAAAPFVDFVLSGEADQTYPMLLRALGERDEAAVARIPGVSWRSGGRTFANGDGEPVQDLDQLPLPDFADFYAARRRAPQVRPRLPSLVVEASRGCWWASTGPCAFCGVDDRERVYRAKGAERVLRELRTLSAMWPCDEIHLADLVVSPSFLDQVVPAIASGEPLPRLFFEARSTLSKSQVAAIGAVRAEIQPGIESFSTRVLRLMHKGTDMLGNIRLLKWCRSAGVKAHWNLLYGVPGETQEDYDAMLAMLPSIRFLEAPMTTHTILVDRYSPYFTDPAGHGITSLTPLSPYRYLYPLPERELERIAYAFDHRAGSLPDVATVLNGEVEQWRHDAAAGELREVESSGGLVRLVDDRPCGLERNVELDALQSLLYRACEDIGALPKLVGLVSTAGLSGVAEDTIREELDSLVERRLMVKDGRRYLSLALPARRWTDD